MDPVHEFASPYNCFGGNPIVYYDPTGAYTEKRAKKLAKKHNLTAIPYNKEWGVVLLRNKNNVPVEINGKSDEI